MEKKSLDRTLTIIILMGVGVLVASYYINTQTMNYVNNNSTPKNNYTEANFTEPIETNISLNNSINMSNATAEDKQFILMVRDSDAAIRKDIKKAYDAANNNDPKSLQLAGKSIEQDSERYLIIIDNMNVSSPLEVVLNENKIALQKFNRAGKYIQSGVINPGDLNLSVDYINVGIRHMDNIHAILKSSNPDNSNITTNITADIGSLTNPTNKDKQFKTWLTLSYRTIADDLGCISKAAKNENFTSTGRCANFLQDDSNRSLKQIITYDNVSISFKPALEQYRKSLQDYNIGGKELETGSNNKDLEKMSAGYSYIQQANKNMTNLMNYFDQNVTKFG